MNSATVQPPLRDTAEQCLSASAVLHRPRLATTHSILFWRDFLFVFSVWWWRERGRVSPKGETGGIQMRTRFCQTIFWGFGFGKTETESSRAEEGSGEESARGSGIRFWRGGLWINTGGTWYNDFVKSTLTLSWGGKMVIILLIIN